MRALCFACLVLAAWGCAPSEEEIKQDFKEFVSKHQACTEDGECSLIHPGCPLGCATAIAANAAAAGQHLAEELIEDFESGGHACAYDCVVICGAACQAGQCAIVKPSMDMPDTCAP
jgi:hypothetical protein